MEAKRVPVLITWDVDPDRWTTLERRQEALRLALDLCEALAIKSTFYITANFAHEYPPEIERMHRLGQEIGCHGLTHTDEEEYDRMPEAMLRNYLQEATTKLEQASGRPVVSFRSPRVKISALTLRLLAEYGYQSDSSVCSQRIDFLSSNLINPGWLVAPRRPYRPHPDNAFKAGTLPLWEIPVSAAVVPFISGSLNVFGLRFMKMMFRLLHAESRYTGKPIVYLAHPPEFILKQSRRTKISLEQLTPRYIRTHGLLLRQLVYRLSGEAWYRASRELFAYMASFSDVDFMTSQAYVDHLGQATQVSP
jgi:peptidoglycan/xylan/chitin deacetylase (PgdA/CDA1 family)